MTIESQKTQPKVRFFSSIRYQLLAIIMLMMIVPIVITQYVGLSTTQSALKARIDENLYESATSNAAELGALLSEQMSLMQVLAENDTIVNAVVAQTKSYIGNETAIHRAVLRKNIDWQAADDTNPVIQNMLTSATSRELAAFRALFPTHLEVYVTDAFGANVAVASRTVDYYQGDEEWWKKAWNDGQGALFIADRIEYNGKINLYNTILAMPIVTPEGQPVGVIRSTLDITALQRAVVSIQIGETGHAVLVNGDAQVLVSRSQADPNPENAVVLADLIPLLDQPYDYQDGAFTLAQDEAGVRHVVAIAPVTTTGRFQAIDNLDWHLAIFQSENEALAPATDALNAVLPVVLVVAVVGLILAYFLGWRLTNPLINLTGIASRIAEGQQGLQAPEQGPREISQLARSFNYMTGQLGQLLEKEENRLRALKREMTQRKQTEEKFRLYMENTHDGVLIVGSDTRFEYANAQLGSILGYPPEEIIGQPFSRFLDKDSLGLVSERLRFRQQGLEVPLRYEFVIRDKNGEKKDVEISVGTTKDSRGDVKTFGTLLDITDRKKAEREISQAYRIINRSPYVAFVWKNDQGWPVEYASKNVKTLVGYSAEEITAGKILFVDIVHPDDLDRVAKEIRQHSEKETSEFIHEPYRVIAKTGEIKWVHDLTHIVRDEQGDISQYEGIVYDITDRKLAEEELHRLRNYLSNIINSMPSVLVGVDSEGRITQWNQQAERATGLLSGQVVAKPLDRVFPRLADQMSAIKTAIRARRVINTPKVSRETDQETRYDDITIYPLVANGVEGAVIRVDDVTEKVRLEEMMIQSEKMLSVGGLAAGMAHEINNPLSGILQNTAVLHNRLFEDLPANQRAAETAGITLTALHHYLEQRKLPDMLENIRSSGLRATTIVKNMLAFARKSERVLSRHDVCALMDRTIELVETDYDMRKQYDFKKIRIKKVYDDADTQVSCEAGKIQQVFLNILKNGAEAMAGLGLKDGEAPAQPAPKFVIRVKGDDDSVQVEIEDNGPGMDARTRRSVFEPFFTTKPAGKGTGLGLSVSYFIVTEDHGGEMGVHASGSGGTCFVIRLPKAARD